MSTTKRSHHGKKPEATATTSEPLATPAAIAALRKQFADYPALDTLERRLLNPEVPGTLPIRLTDEPAQHEDPLGKNRRWHLRWINTAIPGRFQHVTQGRGYVPVVWDELRSRDDIADRFEGAREVRRGDRGVDVLVKMPLAYYRLLKRAEREQASRRGRSVKAQKEELQQVLGQHFGPEAAEAGARFVGDGARELKPRPVEEEMRDPL